MVYPITYINIGICVIFGMINDSELSEITRRIVNGTAAQEGQFPFMVSIQKQHRHICGGSIISSKWVLTATHCLLDENTTDISLVYGSVNLCEHKQCKNLIAEVDEFIMHEEYRRYGVNDIAVIKVKDNLKMNDSVKTVPLNIHQTVFPEGTEGLAIGWGQDSDDSYTSPYLKYVKNDVFSDDVCGGIDNAGSINTALQMCAGKPEGGTGTCHGDSGGPLIVNGYQAGIASFGGSSCGSAESANYYTRVSAYINWIYSKTGLEELKNQQKDRFKLKIKIKIGLKDTNT